MTDKLYQGIRERMERLNVDIEMYQLLVDYAEPKHMERLGTAENMKYYTYAVLFRRDVESWKKEYADLVELLEKLDPQ